MTTLLKTFALAIGLATLASVGLFIWIGSRGISARTEPGAIETAVARTMRSLAVPRADRNRPNPVAGTPEIIAAGMAHFADHCAACHANDGSGDTELGLGLYPRPPDLRREATRSLSDGELFYIIENGVRLTGMPAFGTGTAEGAEETWHLVHFIRHLPDLTEAELADMVALNPKPPADVRQQMEEERFLRGDDAPSAPPAPPTHAH